MKFLDNKTIQMEKELNELDKFVLKFIKILEKHIDYVIISGYVSILLGRTRGTEDIDVFIKKLNKESFFSLYNDLKIAGYWCLNDERKDELYSYLEDGLAIRFASRGETIPNFEVKFAKNKLSLGSFNDRITVITKGGKIKISSLERQIAFKKYYLKSDKDMEDAKHIEEVFKGNIDHEKINIYKNLIIKDGKA
tara:strand:- start:155 stop:736 length:582 start_codon:yes stop_codon:yes gene_type:complete